MGSSFRESLENMNNFIKICDYKNARNSYNSIYENEIMGREDVKIRNLILDYLAEDLEYNSKIKDELIRDITNIEPIDKNSFIFLSYYENKLIRSLDNLGNYLDINHKINIAKDIMNNYLRLKKFKSLLGNKISELYFSNILIEKSSLEKKGNIISSDFRKIKELLKLCLSFSDKKTDNNREVYLKFQKEIERKFNKIYIKELLAKENYEEAENVAIKLKIDDDEEKEEINSILSICYEKIGSKQTDYNESKKYFNKIIDKEKRDELLFKLNEKMINQCLEKEKLTESLKFFYEIFRKPMLKDENFLKLFNVYFDLIIKLFIQYYNENKLVSFFKDVFLSGELLFNEIQENVSNIKFELISLKNIGIDNSFEYIKNNITDEKCQLIKRKISINIILLFIENKNDKKKILKILVKSSHLSLLIKENIDLLIDCFENTNNLEELLYLSKILNKIFITKINSVFNEYIHSFIKKMDKLLNLVEDDELNDCLEKIILTFEDMITKCKKLEKFDLKKVEQILKKIFDRKKNLRYCLIKGFLFLCKNKFILNIDILDSLIEILLKEDDYKILEIIILQLGLDPEGIKNYLTDIFNILINHYNNSIIQKKILLFLKDSIPTELLSTRKSIEKIEEYFNKESNNKKENDENKKIFYQMLERIPFKKRGTIINDILNNRQENSINCNNYINELKNHLFNKEKINKNDLKKIENNLDDPEIVDSLITYLKRQNELFQILDIEKISKIYNHRNKELFELLIDNEIIFNDNALINLLSGFYTNKEKDYNYTFKILNNIKSYQHHFPEIIEINLKIETKLRDYNYSNEIDIKELKFIFSNLYTLKGFSNQHIKFLKYVFDNINSMDKNIIIDEISKLLIEKDFNIGFDNFKQFLNILPKEKFALIYYKILSKKQISYDIKKNIYHYLYLLLENEKDKEFIFVILSKIKFFIDADTIPDYLLRNFISLFKKNISSKINNEILYFLGNYFSFDKKDQIYFLEELIYLQKADDLYQEVVLTVKNIKNQNQLFYIYSSLKYLKCNYENEKNLDLYEVPKTVVINIINQLNDNKNKDLFEENLKYFEKYYDCPVFSPDRDQILRKLYFNCDKKNYEKLKDICYIIY